MTEQHIVRRYTDSRGYVASCACGWRRTSKSRDERERLAREHEAEQTLTVRRADG